MAGTGTCDCFTSTPLRIQSPDIERAMIATVHRKKRFTKLLDPDLGRL
jgi:hypothetical protein